MNNSSFTPLSCGPPAFTWYTHPFNVSMFVLYLLVIITALIGNVLVCMAVIINPVLRQNIASYFIVSLAVSDIATASFSMPFDLESFITFGRWYHSKLLCKVWATVYLVTVPTSVWNLFILSVDRYQTLKNPWDKFRESPLMTRKRALALIAAVWIFGIIFALAPEFGWKLQDGGALRVLCSGKVCIFNVPRLYMILSAVVNFYLPMIAMCFIYYKIYRIASTQFITRPKSALLEMKSDSPAATPKTKNKSKKQAQTDRNSKVTHNDKETQKIKAGELGHDNLAMDHDTDSSNRNKMNRTSTMIEDIDLPGENTSRRHSYNLQDKGQAIDSVDRHTVVIKAVVNETNDKDGNDTQQRKLQVLPRKTEQQEKLQLEQQQQQQPPQNELSNREQQEKQQPGQQETKQTQQSQQPEQQQSHLEQQQQHPNQQPHHHHKLHHQNALVSSDNDNAAGDKHDANDDDNVHDDDNNHDIDDNNIGDGAYVNEKNGNYDHDGYTSNGFNDCNTLEASESNGVNSPNKETRDSDNQNTKPSAESIITVQTTQNADSNQPSSPDKTLTPTDETNDTKDGIPHSSNHARVSYECDNGGSLSPVQSENFSMHIEIPLKRMSSDGTTEVSPQMHQYLRQQVSGDDKKRYGSQASIYTLQSNIPADYGNHIHQNPTTSKDTLNSFGSMEDLTKRQKIFVKNKKAARTIAVIVGAFLVCWLPLTTLSVIKNVFDIILNNRWIVTNEAKLILLYIDKTFLLLGYFNSCINPFIYSYRNVQFRNSYRKLIRILFPCLKTVVRPR